MIRGEVVLLDWPFSDLAGSKLRPAVVVQADFLNGLIDDTIYVKIQGKRYGIPGTEVELDPAIEPTSGLLKRCCASCKDLLTRDQALVHQTLGVLSDAAMQRIEASLRTVLAIP
jgi:mRNA interferase MazF